MTTERVLCAICGVDDAETIAAKGDLTADITNVVCRRCGLVYINPRPTVAAYEEFHVETFLKERHGVTRPEDVAHKVGGKDLEMKAAVLDFIRPFLKPGVRVLDVGCGFGTLSHLIKKEIPDATVEGIELARVDVEAAKRFYGLDLFEGSLEQYAAAHPDARFDVITLHHTFEHFPAPRAELKRMKGLLAPGGVIYIGVPDIMDIRKRPEIFFQIGHPYSYSPATLRKMLAAEGFSVVRWSADAAFPGAMELLAEASPATRPEVSAREMGAGDSAREVADSVERAGKKFGQMRALRDRLLFFLPKKARIAITRWCYLLMKKGPNERAVTFLVAALGGLLFWFPHLLIRLSVIARGERYSFFNFLTPDPLVNLAPMIRDVVDGHWWVSDGRVWEHIDLPNLWSFLDPILVAPLTFLLPTVSDVFFVGHFLFPAIATGFLFALARKITGRPLLSALFACFTVAAGIFWTLLPPTDLEQAKLIGRSLFLGSPPGEILQSKYVSFSVLPGIAFFGAAVYVIASAFESLKRRAAVAAGILVGILIYVYLTDAIYLLAALGMAALVALLGRDWARVRAAVMIGLVAAATGSGYLFNFIAIRRLPHADEFYRRVGGELVRAFRWSHLPEYLIFLVLAALVLLWGRRSGKKGIALTVASLVLAGIVVLNMQLIVGFNPAPTVWAVHQLYLGLGFAWLVVAMMALDLAHAFFRRPRAHAALRALPVLIMVVLIARVVQTEAVWARTLAPDSYLPAPIGRSLDWLNENTPVDSVVASPSLATNALLPVWTHNRSVMPVAVTSPASLSEIRDRWLLLTTLFDIKPETLRPLLERRGEGATPERFMENALMIFLYDSYFFPNTIDAFFGGRQGMRIPAAEVDRLLADRLAYSTDPADLLTRYRIDYLYVGPSERFLGARSFENLPYLEKVYEDAEYGIYLYRVRPEAFDAR